MVSITFSICPKKLLQFVSISRTDISPGMMWLSDKVSHTLKNSPRCIIVCVLNLIYVTHSLGKCVKVGVIFGEPFIINVRGYFWTCLKKINRQKTGFFWRKDWIQDCYLVLLFWNGYRKEILLASLTMWNRLRLNIM